MKRKPKWKRKKGKKEIIKRKVENVKSETKKEKEKRATIREEARKPKKAPEVHPSKRGLRSGGSVNSRAIAKKYFKGGLV